MATEVTIKLDQVTLQTVKMGLAALQMQAQAADASITAQVQAAVEAQTDQAAPQSADPPANLAHLNGHARDPAVEASVDL